MVAKPNNGANWPPEAATEGSAGSKMFNGPVTNALRAQEVEPKSARLSISVVVRLPEESY